MKKVFLGLLVAGVALAGSAFTNAKRLTTAYVVSETGTSPNKVYAYDQNTGRTCDGPSLPCKLTAVSFTFGSTGTISEADLNNTSKVIISSRQSAY
ncbi:hypothetical protein [Pedobacter sp.]|jgi:hypothetical protein|uniref:hypothetical protein n=1 Tax=Pedobacter sp. TaxID=1411316 RepID=UPI002B9E57CD|nr:hypothetical protein [Pedobacter sp.]HWW40148.1 hypothetical protein [Pedobacter sp.]